jgi:2-dehydro-3-deoxy-D-arabinonate dehydratase
MDGLRRVLVGDVPTLVAVRGEWLHPVGASLAELLAAGRDRLAAALAAAYESEALGSAPSGKLAPVDEQEVWASGVTYRRSARARTEESATPDVYELVYEAERPELFLKATPRRVPRPGAPLRIRADSEWDVPEPELALVLDSAGAIAGFLVADDVSSRSIEGANPLYLPQAKIYDDSLGLSDTIALAGDDLGPARRAAIRLRVSRDGESVFAGETSAAEMRRSFEELAEALFCELSHPAGAVLLTGTGIVPPDEFTLRHGDEVEIEIDGIGALRHGIYRKG